MTQKKDYYYYITLKSLPWTNMITWARTPNTRTTGNSLLEIMITVRIITILRPEEEKVDSNSKYKVTTTKKAYLQVLDGMPEQKPLLTCQSPPQSS